MGVKHGETEARVCQSIDALGECVSSPTNALVGLSAVQQKSLPDERDERG